MARIEMDLKLRLNFSSYFRASPKKSILMAVVCFLSVSYGYIFLYMSRVNVVHGLRGEKLNYKMVQNGCYGRLITIISWTL